MSLIPLGVAVSVGLAVAAQAAILGTAARSLHPLTISFALQMAGLLLGITWVVAAGAWSEVTLVARRWWWLPLGLVGFGVVAAIGYAGASLGALPTLVFVVGAQLAGALALDVSRGEVTLGLRQPAGIALLLAGVVLVTGRE